MNSGLGRRAVETIVGLTLAASLLWGCGFRAYERVETAQETRSADAAEKQLLMEKEIRIETAASEVSAEDTVVPQNPDKPEETDAESADVDSGKEDTLLFGGDVYLSDHVLEAYRAAGGILGVLDEGYRAAIRDAGLFFVNEEFPFSTRGAAAADKQYTFRLDPSEVHLFTEMGVDGVTLANNHALDYGADALLDSLSTLDGAGILHTGAGENLEAAKKAACYEIGGKKIAVIGASRVFPTADWAAGQNHPGMLSAYDPAALLSEIRSLKETQDLVIVYVHWGEERSEQPNVAQKSLGRQLIDAGADLVIGAHPHVLQGIEYYQGKPIVYSLGNFVFGSSIPRTALLEVTVGQGDASAGTDGEPGFRLIPGRSLGGYTRTLADDAERRAFYEYMQNISFGVSIDDEGRISPQ